MKTCNVWPLDDHYAIAADDRDTNTRREHGAALLASEWQALSLMLEMRKELKKRLKQVDEYDGEEIHCDHVEEANDLRLGNTRTATSAAAARGTTSDAHLVN